MKVTPLRIPDVLLIEPVVYTDPRGYFFESFNRKRFEAAVGRTVEFVQDNQSRSSRNVLRGLHYQIERPQAKLVRVLTGEIFDVAVDIRRSSPTFGQWVATRLSAENRSQIWIPEGFAHGFLALSEVAEVFYKTNDYRAAEFERTIVWNDETLAIDWPNEAAPTTSEKDGSAPAFADAAVYR